MSQVRLVVVDANARTYAVYRFAPSVHKAHFMRKLRLPDDDSPLLNEAEIEQLRQDPMIFCDTPTKGAA